MKALVIVALVAAAFLFVAYLAFGSLFHYSGAWAADATPAQIAACAPDAQRLCEDRIPHGTDAIKACMLAHKAELSQACREAFHK